MQGRFFRGVSAYIVAIALVMVVAVLVSIIYFTDDKLPWTAFLMGILIASLLAETARASRSEWGLMRRTSQLSALKEQCEFETSLRKRAEETILDNQLRLRLIDETLLTMITLIDIDGVCRYHNRAFRDWLNFKTDHIDGRTLRELLGSKAYAGIATAVKQSLDGQSVRYEHFMEMSKGSIYRLSVEHIPQFDSAGHVTGFYLLAEDMTRRDDLKSLEVDESAVSASRLVAIHSNKREHSDQTLYLDTFSEQVGGRPDAAKQFILAIQGGQFDLYCQLISPLPLNVVGTAHYEILIRLSEEEGNLVPPGAFFPLAEENGLMPYLDRWVVQHVLEWAVSQRHLNPDDESIFFINVASATIGDPGFPGFLTNILFDLGVTASSLCFEVSETDLLARNSSVAAFIHQIRQLGCRVALSGFGRSGVSFDQIRGFQVEFLKIDGGIILNMLSDPVALAKVVSINQVAKKIGVKTVAELVESDEVVTKLSEMGVDYVQGFGISHPRRLQA
ncbi:MAG: EAL domain-containing protein [Gallionella sp.]